MRDTKGEPAIDSSGPETRFADVADDAFSRAQQALGLMPRAGGSGIGRRIVLVVAITWLPLVLRATALWQRRLLPGTVNEPLSPALRRPRTLAPRAAAPDRGRGDDARVAPRLAAAVPDPRSDRRRRAVGPCARSSSARAVCAPRASPCSRWSRSRCSRARSAGATPGDCTSWPGTQRRGERVPLRDLLVFVRVASGLSAGAVRLGVAARRGGLGVRAHRATRPRTRADASRSRRRARIPGADDGRARAALPRNRGSDRGALGARGCSCRARRADAQGAGGGAVGPERRDRVGADVRFRRACARCGAAPSRAGGRCWPSTAAWSNAAGFAARRSTTTRCSARRSWVRSPTPSPYKQLSQHRMAPIARRLLRRCSPPRSR